MHSARRTFFLIAALATTAALAALGASSALAAPNEIAYRCGPDVCLLDPNNPSAVTNLTDNGTTSYDESPAWSPDGKRLAFVSNFSEGTRNVFVMEPDAAGQSVNIAVQVTHYKDGGYLNDPVWSPDGTKIAFTRGVDEGSRSILVAAADGSTVTPVTIAEHGQHPSWAPDSGKIAYSYGPQIYLRNGDGSGVATPLPNGMGREPAWAPDGSRIAFDSPAPGGFAYLGIVSAAGTGTPVILEPNTQWTFATWSPDGSRVAYRSTVSNDGYFRVVNADGSGDHGLPVVQGVNGYLEPPSWSPDGTRLVYPGYHYTEAGSPFKLELGNTNGLGSIVSITSAESDEPVWRPNPAAAPQVITPSGGSSGPLPGPTQKPKTVWITKRIPWTPGPDLTIIVLSVGCGGPVCNAGGQGTSKGAIAAGIRPRPGLVAADAKAKPKKPPRVVVGKLVKTTIPGGQTRPIKMKLTAAGVKLLTQLGKLAIDIELTIATPGRPTVVEHHKVNVFVKKVGKKKHKHG